MMRTFFHGSQFNILTNPKLKENFVEEKEKKIKVRNKNKQCSQRIGICHKEYEFFYKNLGFYTRIKKEQFSHT